MDNEGKTATKSTEEKLALAKELGTIVQIGIVVEDMDRQSRGLKG